MSDSVEVVVERGAERTDVVVDVHRRDATVGELLRALGVETSAAVAVDGRPSEPSSPIGGLRRGSVVTIGEPSSRTGPCPDRSDGARLEPTAPLVRGPRRSPPSPPRAPIGPGPIPTREPVAGPGTATIVVPLVLAALTALLWNPLFALFALIAPVVSVVTWLDARRRSRRTFRRESRAHLRGSVAHAIAVRTHRRRVAELRERWMPTAAGTPRLITAGRMWERRKWHEDRLVVRLGRAPGGGIVTVRLPPGGIVGVVGADRIAAGRALVLHLVVHHGPADCTIAVVGHAGAWEWMKWLPHVETAEGLRAVAPALDEALARACDVAVVEGGASGPELAEILGRHGSTAIVLTETVEQLPASTALVVDTDRSSLWSPGDGRRWPFEPETVDEATALGIALRLAPFHDPERVGGGRIDDSVRLVDLLDGVAPEEIATRWKRSATARTWTAPIGRGRDGPVEIDLRRHGPHALVGGTTGSGKSELLRTLVLSLAASLDPTRCNFVLIDYKGGSAFDACADLPHTVGLVTDLDEGLAERALVCLDAELRRRERLLRSAGASDLEDYTPGSGAEPMPRLVVVVDEFAAMTSDLPDFVDRLIDVAQRGRSLGIHLVLATQRPSGVVGDSIRANVDIRIALRVQSPADSRDVVDDAGAAEIPRSFPGRALLRLGSGTTVVQTAFTGAVSAQAEPVTIRPFHLEPAAGAAPSAPLVGGVTDLERIVESISAAAAAAHMQPGSSPWPDPLPDSVTLDELGGAPPGSAFGWIDDPVHQRRVPLAWSPEEGHLLLVGLPGSGTTTALGTLAVVLASGATPPDVYVVAGDGSLDGLASLGNVGGVVGMGDDERVLRLLRMLSDRSSGGARAVLLVDGLDALLAAAADAGGEMETLLVGLFGVEGGPSIVGAVRRASAVPQRILGLCPRRLLFTLADRYDYRALGSGRDLVDPVPGRAIEVPGDREAQVALPHLDGLAAAVRSMRGTGATTPPPGVTTLSATVPWQEIASAAHMDGDTWWLPVGIDDRHRRPALLRIDPATGVLVAGPACSGRTTALATLAAAARTIELEVVAIAPPRSPLRQIMGGVVDTEGVALQHIERARRGVLVLVDDADALDLPAIAAAADAEPARVRVVGVGQTGNLRRSYGSWPARLGESGIGLLLDARRHDGELLGVSLPSRTTRRTAGRGWLVNRDGTHLVQVALPPT